MKRLKFINCDKKISTTEIESVENKYNFKYPEEIKKHYLKCNGGYPNKELYEYDGEEYKINYFLSIGNKVNSFEKIYELLRSDDVFPSWLIPFADDEGGNFFAFSVLEKDYGSIYYYSHEFELGEDPALYVKKISDNFSSFLSNLKMEEEDDTDINTNSGFRISEEWVKQMAANLHKQGIK